MLGYDFLINGSILSIVNKDKKTYGDKTTEEHKVLNFMRLGDKGDMQPVSVKCFFPLPDDIKAGDKVSLKVSLSAMDRNIYYTGLGIQKQK